DRKFQSGKRLGPGIFRDLFFFAISLRRFAVELARAVLSAHGASAGLVAAQTVDGVEDLHLLVSDRIGRERDGRFHRGERDELKQVVRDHIAQSTRLVIVTAPTLHTERLSDRDLNMVDEIAVPDRFKDAVPKAEDK